MSHGMKCWGPDGNEIFSTKNTAPAQLYTLFSANGRGGERAFPELGSRKIYLCAVPLKFEPIGLQPMNLNVYAEYSNGWPMVRWNGWEYDTPFAFYVFTT